MKVRPLVMEFFGTGLITAAVAGAGYMASGTTQDAAIGLIMNALSACAMLAIVIRLGAKISGAHYNPAVSLVLLLAKKVDGKTVLTYIPAQIAGAIAGAILANSIYGAHIFAISTTVRSNSVFIISEIVATAGLVWVVLRNAKNANKVALYVPLWILSAYFFTSSTTFANPAITIGRVFTQSPVGIAPASILRFISAQFVGAILGWALFSFLEQEPEGDQTSLPELSDPIL